MSPRVCLSLLYFVGERPQKCSLHSNKRQTEQILAKGKHFLLFSKYVSVSPDPEVKNQGSGSGPKIQIRTPLSDCWLRWTAHKSPSNVFDYMTQAHMQAIKRWYLSYHIHTGLVVKIILTTKKYIYIGISIRIRSELKKNWIEASSFHSNDWLAGHYPAYYMVIS